QSGNNPQRGGTMRHGLACLGVVLLAGFSISTAQQQDKSKENPPPAASAGAAAPTDTAKPASTTERKNPGKPTPEGIAAVKKIYGYDCAMCHGTAGDGKGELVGSMNLTLKNWREPGALAGISDGDMYDMIVKGKGKMIGEGDRLPPEKAWNMVHYVRSFAKKDGGTDKEAAATTPKS